MTDIRKAPSFSAILWKLLWIAVTSFALLGAIRWALGWFGVPMGELKYWGMGILYLWFNFAVLTLGWHIYWRAREVKARLLRRKPKIKPEQGFDFEGNMQTIERVERHGLRMAIIVHLISALAIFFLSAYATENIALRWSATLLSIALAGLKPMYLFTQSTIQMVLEIDSESCYPEKTVSELWYKVESLLDLEKRLMEDFTKKTALVEEEIQKQQKRGEAIEEESREKAERQAKLLQHQWQTHAEGLTAALAACQQEIQSYKLQVAKLHTAILDKLSSFENSDSRVMQAIRTINENPDIQNFINRRNSTDLLPLLESLQKHLAEKK